MLVDTRELRRFVVRIDSSAGKPLGTGFFAAPGYVLTCAHVVNDLGEAAVVPTAPAVDVGAGLWRVAARSSSPPPGWQSALWPFPDLAVLYADGETDHPCPLLMACDPAGDQRCHSWGYAQYQAGVVPDGSPASFRFDGVNGVTSGYLELRDGQAAPGLSGSPLVCPVRRAVVGVVAASKGTRTDLGGWAAPLSALLSAGQDVPDDLAELGVRIRDANRAAVLRYRREWNAVLPANADGMLRKPWETFIRRPQSTPASLLQADFGVVPYLFREVELKEAVDWCEGADWSTPMSVMQVTAPGGAGKTRFAIELCRVMQERGWVTGLWRDASGLAQLPLPRLIVIDYAQEGAAAELEECLDTLTRCATALAPVRVLLLTRDWAGMARNAVDELRRTATATVTRVLDQVQDSPAARIPLTPEQRAELYREAMHKFIAAWCPLAGQARGGTGAEDIPDLSDNRYGLALDVLFEALDAVLARCDDIDGTAAVAEFALADGGSPVERALAHEEKYWRVTAPRPWRDDPEVLRECVALATLAGAAAHAEADALLAVSPRFADPVAAPARHQIISWLSSLYGGSGTLGSLRPDRLGEWLVASSLRAQPDGGQAFLARVLDLPSDEQAERCLEMLARICAYNRPIARTAAAAIGAVHATLISRAEAQWRGEPGMPGRLALAGAMQQLLTPRFSSLIGQELADADPGYRRDLRVTYDKLAGLALDAGRPDDAEALYRHALTLAQELADADPANTGYRRDLCVTYNKLAGLAFRNGLDEEAVQWTARALLVRRQLVQAGPERLDFAEELAYALYDSATSGLTGSGAPDAAREIVGILDPFEQRGYLTPQARTLLAWARAEQARAEQARADQPWRIT